MARTYSVKIYATTGGMFKMFMTVGETEDGKLMEIFLRTAKHGSTLNGLLDWIAISLSQSIQEGIPLSDLIETAVELTFEPFGPTDDPDVPSCTSVANYVLRRLALDYLTEQEREAVGL